MNKYLMWFLLIVFAILQGSSFFSLKDINANTNKTIYMVEVVNKFNLLNEKNKDNRHNVVLTDKISELTNHKNENLNVELFCDYYVCYYREADFGKLKNYVLMFDYPTKENIDNIVLNYDYFTSDLLSTVKKNTVNRVVQQSGNVLESDIVLGYIAKPKLYKEDSLDNISKLRVYNVFFLGALQKNLITLEEYQQYANKSYKIVNDMYSTVNYNENLLYESMVKLNESCDSALIIQCSAEDFISAKAKLLLVKYNDMVSEYKEHKEELGYEVLNRSNMFDFFNGYRDGKNMGHPYILNKDKDLKLTLK